MNHKFIPSMLDPILCIECKQIESQHTSQAVCESCDKIGPVEMIYGDMALCSDCIEREKEADTSRVESAETRVSEAKSDMQRRLEIVRQVDSSLQVKSDLFNAKTVAILELKDLIYADDSIQNKPYVLAETLTARFLHFKKLIFDMQQDIIDKSNEQKAIQTYLNTLANQLRSEEREKLKLSDINYQPKSVAIHKPKSIKVNSSKKIDKAELKKYATELGIGEYMIQMLVTAKGITVEQAAGQIRKSMAEAKSEMQS